MQPEENCKASGLLALTRRRHMLPGAAICFRAPPDSWWRPLHLLPATSPGDDALKPGLEAQLLLRPLLPSRERAVPGP
ncbi:uncharacterized protein LOC142557009 [Dermacentor variabilis]|uniref:uncharacterized protein LOC142557009 n=1 Tax=Dermacentor variabilis TaxID=34621 RepID=UPI003F5BD95D